ncbi:hypothetical protein ACA910_021613 [Epithemia clementina (nom. ined.)]
MRGIQLKHFERVVKSLLETPEISVQYSQLPWVPEYAISAAAAAASSGWTNTDHNNGERSKNSNNNGISNNNSSSKKCEAFQSTTRKDTMINYGDDDHNCKTSNPDYKSNNDTNHEPYDDNEYPPHSTLLANQEPKSSASSPSLLTQLVASYYYNDFEYDRYADSETTTKTKSDTCLDQQHSSSTPSAPPSPPPPPLLKDDCGGGGSSSGYILDPMRARRKEQQLQNMIQCIVALLYRVVLLSHDRSRHDWESRSRSSNKSDNESASASWDATLVDFGGGSGHLAISLALLLPHCRIIVVELSQRSLQLLHQKADFQLRRQCRRKQPQPQSTQRQQEATASSQPEPSSSSKCHFESSNSTAKRESGGGLVLQQSSIPNLYTFHGSIEAFAAANNNNNNNNSAFCNLDIGIALHLCGEATDVALRACGQANAQALVFCPCCVGKLNAGKKNPYVWQATGQNTPTVTYPQSSVVQTVFDKRKQQQQQQQQQQQSEKDWNVLAKAADYGDEEEDSGDTVNGIGGGGAAIRNSNSSFFGRNNATRRMAKALLETDRLLFLQERYGYETALTRMEPWDATPKNDILLAWKMTTRTTATEPNMSQQSAHHHQQSWLDMNKNNNYFYSQHRSKPHHPSSSWWLEPNPKCLMDMEATKQHLFPSTQQALPSFTSTTTTTTGAIPLTNPTFQDQQYSKDAVECAAPSLEEEEEEIFQQITAFFNKHPKQEEEEEEKAAKETQERGMDVGDSYNDKNKCGERQGDTRAVLVFPTGLGRRRRKLIHYVAEQMQLAHWCVGRKKGDKTVAVARPRLRL